MADLGSDSTDRVQHHGVVKIFGKNRNDAPKRLIFNQNREKETEDELVIDGVDDDKVLEAKALEVETEEALPEEALPEEALPEEALPEETLPGGTEADDIDEDLLEVAKVDDEDEVLLEVVEAAETVEALLPDEEEVKLPAELEAVFRQAEGTGSVQLEHPLEAKVRELMELVSSTPPIPDDVLEDDDTNEDVSLLAGEPSRDIELLLDDKVREFRFLGYGHITSEHIWTYFQQLRKRRPRNLHELVNGILSLQPQAVMNYDLQTAYRNSSESLEDILNDLR